MNVRRPVPEDAENFDGAARLCERAGMRVLWRAVVWEKELRAGG